MKNPYEILNIPQNSTELEIQKSYKRLVRLYHPLNGGSNEDFIQLNKAYAILKNKKLRNFYDFFGDDFLSILLDNRTGEMMATIFDNKNLILLLSSIIFLYLFFLLSPHLFYFYKKLSLFFITCPYFFACASILIFFIRNEYFFKTSFKYAEERRINMKYMIVLFLYTMQYIFICVKFDFDLKSELIVILPSISCSFIVSTYNEGIDLKELFLNEILQLILLYLFLFFDNPIIRFLCPSLIFISLKCKFKYTSFIAIFGLIFINIFVLIITLYIKKVVMWLLFILLPVFYLILIIPIIVLYFGFVKSKIRMNYLRIK